MLWSRSLAAPLVAPWTKARRRPSTLHSSSSRSNHGRTSLPPRFRDVLRHDLRPLSATEVAHSPLKSGLAKRRTSILQVLQVKSHQLAPQPTPEFLHGVQIRRAGRHSQESHLLSAARLDRNSRMQKALAVAEHSPRPIPTLSSPGATIRHAIVF